MSSDLSLANIDDAPRIELIHGWEFLTDPDGKFKITDIARASGWRKARVGIGWNALFEDLREYMGVAWYRTRFESPQFSENRHVLLKFGAVDYFAEVYVNGALAGTHEGGYTPFSVDATSAVKPGMNELAVRVIDPPMDEAQNLLLCPDMMYHEIPHGKQNWYVQNAGIWQGVRAEFCPEIYIESIRVSPNISGDFRADVLLAGSALHDHQKLERNHLLFTVCDSSGRVVLEETIAIVSPDVQSFRGTIKKPRLWNLDDPALYTLEVQLVGEINYRKRVRFGFRKFEARDGRLFLNDQPFYMRGALDQDFYPETIHTPASEEYVREMMIKAKRLGLNVLRCHLKICHPVYLTVADEVGILVWAEVPSWSDCWYPADHFSTKAAERGKKMFQEMIERDWNHPCIVIQTIMNESWGIDLKDSMQRAWLKDTFNWVKEELGPVGRLVVDNSACENNFHLRTDLEDFHNYYSMPDHVDLWEKWTAELASRPDWTFSPYGDAERTRKEPVIVSEFGNWGLPRLPEDLPWWFAANFGGREVTRPAGVHDRYKQYRLDELFGEFNNFAEETQWHQFISLKHEIEDIRRHQEIQGYIITGMTDIHWEVNGLLDMWRNPKIFTNDLNRLQQQDVVLLEMNRYNFWTEQEVNVGVMLSHYGAADVRGARVRWMLDSGPSGQFEITEALPSGAVARLKEISFRSQSVSEPTRDRILIEVRLKSGVLAENSYDLFVYPTAHPVSELPLVFHDPIATARDLDKQLVRAGYRIEDSSDALLISTRLDDRTERHLSRGGKAILLLDDERAISKDAPLSVKKRWGTELDGRWFSNFNWVRHNAAPYDKLTFNRILGFEAREVVPEHVITGVASDDFQDVLSGATFGWVQRNSALTMQMGFAEGKALLTTYRFGDYGRDPYATHLLDSYIRYTQQEAFAPKLQWLEEASIL